MELFKNWQWDAFHIGATLFLILIAFAVGWIIYDSWFKKKFNGREKEKR